MTVSSLSTMILHEEGAFAGSWSSAGSGSDGGNDSNAGLMIVSGTGTFGGNGSGSGSVTQASSTSWTLIEQGTFALGCFALSCYALTEQVADSGSAAMPSRQGRRSKSPRSPP
jgi:hypothetical protein